MANSSCGISEAAYFTIPKKLCFTESKNLRNYLAMMQIEAFDSLRANGWTFYVVDQSRGRCYYASKNITIPVWVFKRTIQYVQWYIGHEMSHAYAGSKADHGPIFMEWLKKLVPYEALHFELGYKPRNAAKAGIFKACSIDEL